jgi:hypothetical protein
VQSIAEYGLRASDKSIMPVELLKVESAIHAAQSSPLAKPLNVRFQNFIDHDASFVTMLSSSSLFDIILSKKLALVLIFSGATLGLLLFSTMWVQQATDDPLYQRLWYTRYTLVLPFTGAILACLAAACHSPRAGRYLLGISFMCWAILDTISFILSAWSAIYDQCSLCGPSTPPGLSTIQTVLVQFNNWLYIGVLSFCILMRQHYTVPLGSVYFVLLHGVLHPIIGYSALSQTLGRV